MFRTGQKLFTFKSPVAQCISMCVHTEVKIPVPWGHIAGKWWNKNGNRPILAVHGWQDNANTFDTLVPLMSPHLSVLAIDLPGHGLSSHFPAGFNLHRMTGIMTLKRIVDHFAWKNVSLIGHSLGGQTCFLYAAIYPDIVDALVTLDILAPTPMNAKRFIKGGGRTIDDFLRRDGQKLETSPTYSYHETVKMVVNSPIAPVSKEAAMILIERGSEKTEDGKFRFTRDSRVKGFPTAGWSSPDVLKFCHGIKGNILCIKAESSDYYGSKEFFEESWAAVTRSAKNAELKYAPGSHHFHLENPEAVAPIINEFFDKY